ncbi:MAG: leucyl aminopeptidase [Syntrophothermus sp.]
MEVEVRAGDPLAAAPELLAIGLPEGGSLPEALAAAPGADAARPRFKSLASVFPADGPRVLVVGLGEPEKLDAERLRVAAAVAVKEAARLEAARLAWVPPDGIEPRAAVAALVTGTVLGAYRFDRFRRDPDEPRAAVGSLTLFAAEELAPEAAAALTLATAQNRARDLQNTPANFATPAALADRAIEIAAEREAVSADVLGREEIVAMGMGGLAAVSQGSVEEPRLIVLRYAGGSGETVGLVGKGVTFDTGGISLKPGASMHEMKFDMSGGAAVLEAVAAVADLGLALDLLAVVPATENMPSGSALKPGDVITQYNRKTVEVNNTDAEGRLILADALAYAIELGATRLVDIATLTGAVVIALGSTHAAVVSNDDDLARELVDAGAETGELTWRLPMHPEYSELMKGTVADLSNLAAKREAGTITAASFLAEFVDGTPWAHIDIAGTAWGVGRAYTGEEASGFGVRLLAELARRLAG